MMAAAGETSARGPLYPRSSRLARPPRESIRTAASSARGGCGRLTGVLDRGDQDRVVDRDDAQPDFGHRYSSSRPIVSPVRARDKPRRARSWAPGMLSSTAAMLAASESISSIAVESSELASVPSWTWVRSANLARRAACSGSSATFSR
jgi:hypothetical protein